MGGRGASPDTKLITMSKLRYNYNKVTFSKRNNILRSAGFNNYQEYLNSDLWKKIKDKASKRDFWKTCNTCGSKENLRIHHAKYRAENLLEGKLNNLLPICQPCHDKIHDISREKNYTFRRAAKKLRKENDFVYLKTKERKIKVKKVIVIGNGEPCPSCRKPMQRRKHGTEPKTNYFYTEWDYCRECCHVQHYEKYKSSDWREDERQQSFFRDLKNGN